MKPHRTARRHQPDALSRLKARASTTAPAGDAPDASCRRCGAEPSIGAHHVLVTGEVVCPDCTKHTDTVTAHVLMLGDTPDGSASDREWFAANPGTDWRLRKALPGEARELAASSRYLNTVYGRDQANPLDPDATHVMTIQLEPGKRMRLPCYAPTDPAELATWLEVEVPNARAFARWNAGDQPNMPVVTHLASRYAAALDTLGFKSMWDHAEEQGQAMREAKRNTRQ